MAKLDYIDGVLIRLTNEQVETVNTMLKKFAYDNGKVKTSAAIEGFILDQNGNWVYVPEAAGTPQEPMPFVEVGDQNLSTYPKRHVKYGAQVPSKENYVYKIRHWGETGDTRYEQKGLNILTDPQVDQILNIIIQSSGSYQENDWVYSLTGTDENHRADQSPRGEVTLDVRDRRLDDPNQTLELAGNVTVGISDDPEMRSKFTVMGESEGQDGTVFGRLVDFYGEGGGQKIKEQLEHWGHQVPNENWPKIYMNRGEDRFNGEDWIDGYSQLDPKIGRKIETYPDGQEITSGANYGLGLGTVEATKEIVSHTTITADRGLIVEDGVGDPTDRGITKYVEYEEGPNGDLIPKSASSFIADGELTHPTNNFAMQIKHDGARIQGHTFIKDEVDKNVFKLVNGNIYYPSSEKYNQYDQNSNEDIQVNSENIIRDCWFCKKDNPDEGQEPDWQYGHWCTQKDGQFIYYIDMWPGFLYHENDKQIELKASTDTDIYIYTLASDDKEYYLTYDENEDTWEKHEILDVENAETNYYRAKGDVDKNNQYFVSQLISVNKHFMPGLDSNNNNRRGSFILNGNGKIIGYNSKINERIVPETHKVYQIAANKPYQYDPTPSGDITEFQLLAFAEEQGVQVAKVNGGDYIYWDGTYFQKITGSYPNYKVNAGYGSLTVGTREANSGEEKIKVNDTIGKHSLEVGTGIKATGDNAVATGQDTIASGKNSHAEGSSSQASGSGSHAEGNSQATGAFSHAEGNSLATQNYAHSEGWNNHARGIASHVEGHNTETTGEASHAEGIGSHATHNASHAEGQGTNASGQASHAEGKNTIVNGEASHAEGYNTTVNGKNSHVEGEDSIINEKDTDNVDLKDSHAEGKGHSVDRSYQHLQGTYSKTTHDVYPEYSRDSGDTATVAHVRFAVGNGTGDAAANRKNAFAVTENGDAYVQNHFEVDGTSDLSKKVTIGDSVANHETALKVLKHSVFDQNVTIERDPSDTAAQNVDLSSISFGENSFNEKGRALFGDTVTIGKGNEKYYKYQSNNWEEVEIPQDNTKPIVDIYGYNNLPTGAAIQTDTFYKVISGTFGDNMIGDIYNRKSKFDGLVVNGEIKNPRIPSELYTSMPINGTPVLNQFADKFFVNSSIATATATFRGSFSAIDYNPHKCESVGIIEVTNFPTSNIDETQIYKKDNEYYQYIASTWIKVDVKECNRNLPTKYTNQIIYATYLRVATYTDLPEPTIGLAIHYVIDEDKFYETKLNETTEEVEWVICTSLNEDNVKFVIFHLANDWEPETTIHPYTINRNITAGYYRFYYDKEEGDPEIPNVDTKDEKSKTDWLKSYITDMYVGTMSSDHKINTYTELISLSSHDSNPYYVISEDEFYEYDVTAPNNWKPCYPAADKNDYCYFQIWDMKTAEPYVLFAEKIFNDDPNNPVDPPIGTDNEPDVLDREADMEIACERYKFIVANHPTEEQEIESYWKFEYQLNNSGFTQAQWAAINSGISGAWMSDIERRLLKEIQDRIEGDSREAQLRESADTYIKDNWVKKDEVGNLNKPVYIGTDSDGYWVTKECSFQIYGDRNNEGKLAFYYDDPNHLISGYCYNSKITIPQASNNGETIAFQSWVNTQITDATSGLTGKYVTADSSIVDQRVQEAKFFEKGLWLSDNPRISGAWIKLTKATNSNGDDYQHPYVTQYTLPSMVQLPWDGTDYGSKQELVALWYLQNKYYDNTNSYSKTEIDNKFVDLSNNYAAKIHTHPGVYVTPTELNNTLNNYVTTTQLTQNLNNYATKDEILVCKPIYFSTDVLTSHSTSHSNISTYIISYEKTNNTYKGICQFTMYREAHYANNDDEISYYLGIHSHNDFSKFKIKTIYLDCADPTVIRPIGKRNSTHWNSNYDDFYFTGTLVKNPTITAYLEIEFEL